MGKRKKRWYGTAYEAKAPEHGKTIIETVKGEFPRVDYRMGYKIK
ncbi:MAG: XtrA/YqaO family protein [Bacillus sp. (in: Bacteria)]|nr:XtrA/YqaO family protein [Bacillus paralicheniformis]MBW4886166.1 XtrA/YqaO family protein [Bacillus sp. (in: firmicutes)]MBX9434561.1 XtrA/YqaO family protein [Bacillus paralicheniformis]MBZ5215019.1 hypothetical protein [Bacillus paralicheniformis]